MNFYVRYMDMHNFVVDNTASPNVRFVCKGIFSSLFETDVSARLYRANSLYGPTNYNGGLVGATEGLSNFYWNIIGSTYLPSSPLSNQPARNIEWALSGSQLGWTQWDMSSKEVFKTQLINYYSSSMNTAGMLSYYETKFGTDFLNLDYNVYIYWGYPLNPDGTPYPYLVTYECIYLGNDANHDEIVAG